MNYLQLTNKLSIAGENIKFFGESILKLITIVSVVFFWFIVFTYYQPYQEIAFLMLNSLRLGLILFIIGFLMHYLFYFINELIHRRQMNKVEVNVK